MQPNRLRSGGFAGKSEPCRVSEVCKPELWVTPQVPMPSPKRDRVITKATAVSPLSRLSSQSCALSAGLSGIFGYFCFPDKSDSPISLRSKRGETAFKGTLASAGENCRASRAKPRLTWRILRQQNRAFPSERSSQTFNCGLLRSFRSYHSNGTGSSRRQQRCLR